MNGRELLIVLLSLCSVQSIRVKESPEVLGYWENWNNVLWWGNNIPGNCVMGCAKPNEFMQFMQFFSSVNYGFTFLTGNPDPDRVKCDTPAGCPVWDGVGIYIAHASQPGALVVNNATDINSVESSPGLIGISEVCRLARQGPYGPRRCKVTLGGWSDWARLGNVQNAQHAGALAAKMVLLSFADGIDLDFEHLAEFDALDPGNSEYASFVALVMSIRSHLDAITPSVWANVVQTRLRALQAEYAAMPGWQQKASPYYPTNIQYMQDLLKIGVPPYFEISFTTRFNGFLDTSSPFNYLMPNSPVPPPFASDNEVAKMWKSMSDAVDTVNIMAYDAGSSVGPLKLNFKQIFQNFVTFGPVPPTSINMGFEPGDQAGGGVWEGRTVDAEAMKAIHAQQGGAMIWAINPGAAQANSTRWVPVVSQDAYSIFQPEFPYPPVPAYTKCDPTTGWIVTF